MNEEQHSRCHSHCGLTHALFGNVGSVVVLTVANLEGHRCYYCCCCRVRHGCCRVVAGTSCHRLRFRRVCIVCCVVFLYAEASSQENRRGCCRFCYCCGWYRFWRVTQRVQFRKSSWKVLGPINACLLVPCDEACCVCCGCVHNWRKPSEERKARSEWSVKKRWKWRKTLCLGVRRTPRGIGKWREHDLQTGKSPNLKANRLVDFDRRARTLKASLSGACELFPTFLAGSDNYVDVSAAVLWKNELELCKIDSNQEHKSSYDKCCGQSVPLCHCHHLTSAW